nr:unnamed protein product [Callosobruchus chinensis]
MITFPGQFIPPADFQSLDPNIQAYIQQMTYNQYMQQFQQQSSNNSYAQIVSNVNKDNPYTANMPQIPQTVQQQQPEQDVAVEELKRPVKKSLHSLAAAYGSGSDSEDEDDREDEKNDKVDVAYKKPTGEMQVIIDKMASYVSKNGEQFEEIVKAKADPRFDFLNDSNEFNKYYREKIREIKGEKTEEIAEKIGDDDDDDDDEKKEKEESETKVAKKEKKVIAPVCFSIKKLKDTPELKSALPMEDTDEEEEENNAATPPVNAAPPSLVTSLKQIIEHKKNDRSSASEDKPTEVKNQEKSVKSVVSENRQSDSKVEKLPVKQHDIKNIDKGKQSKKPDAKKIDTDENGTNDKNRAKTKRKRSTSKEMSPKKNGILDGDDPILEVMELTGEDIEASIDKTAEDKRKHKLAAAKEKLNAVSRLQLERKRKAAAFLKLKSAETLQSSSSEVVDHAVDGNRCGSPESIPEASR